MCGIAGLLNLDQNAPVDEMVVRRMLSTLVHRGPDDEGTYVDGPVGLGTRRLKVIDLEGGHQPLQNEDGTVWVSFNGEIFNYETIREGLKSRGHKLSTRSDTEVLVHLYEEVGERLVDQLNGQFAFALWDSRKKVLLLARDRFGVRPLFFTTVGHRLLWASEIKALLAVPEVPARLDPIGLEHLFVFASPSAPRTLFEGIEQLPAGYLLKVEEGRISRRCYWDLDFFPEKDAIPDLGEEHYVEQLRTLMEDSVRLQLRADVPVGVYLSGGLDSSTVAALVGRVRPDCLSTFSIGFEESFFDEMPHARRVVRHLNARPHEFICRHHDVVTGLPAAIFFTEHPSLTTEMVPLMYLSKLARENVTVILTGEGADEAFGGYRYFRLDKVRRILSTFPFSLMGGFIRWLVKKKIGTDSIFPAGKYVKTVKSKYGCYPAMQYEFDLGRRLLESVASPELSRQLAGHVTAEDLCFPRERLMSWHPFDQATYFSYKMRLSNHQIGPLGDRASMANSVEGRYPFLDYRIVEFAARIPRHHKLRGFSEKHILRKALGHLLPKEISRRKKQQFQAPFGSAFLSAGVPEYVEEMLSERTTRDKGYFDPVQVRSLIDRLKHYREVRPGQVDYDRVLAEVGLVAVITTHLWDHIFLKNRGTKPADLAERSPGLNWFKASPL